jgi:alkylation response protein AidB-like acyl-CoA dehydrogenase
MTTTAAAPTTRPTGPAPGVPEDDGGRAELVALAEDLLATHSGVEHLRGRLEEGRAHDAELWKRLVDADLVSILVPEAQGGAGLDPTYLSGVLYSLGRHATPGPFLETAVVAATVLGGLPGSDDAASWGRRVAAGEAVVAVRLGALTPYVVHATDADLLLDLGDDGSVRAYTASEVLVRPVAAVDPLRPMARVEPRGAGTLLGTDPALVARARSLAVSGAACLLAGAARALVDHTVDYVGVRHQFGRPVGSFQAIKHAVADMAVMADMATAAALGAFDAVATADPDDAWRRARAAKAYAGSAADLANVSSLQLHGGIGFTWEYHLHLWLKRVMSLAASYGTTTALRRDLARELLAARRGAGS